MNKKQKTKAQKIAAFEGWLSIFINIILFILKYTAGILTHSVSIIADAWHTLSDSFTSIVVLVSIKMSGQPADQEHPFGHGRVELIASIMIGTILGMVGFNFLFESISKLMDHQPASFNKIAIIVFIISTILKEIIASFSIWAGKKYQLNILKADGWHHRSDAIASFVILIAIILGRNFWWIDGVFGILVSLLILFAAYEIVKEGAQPLMGEKPDLKLITKIKEIAFATAGNQIDLHHIHMHRYGAHIELTFHIKLTKNLSLENAHSIANEIEDNLRKQLNIEATIHVEPKLYN
ncbi:MAG: cation diffusion facilitator family transporter [Spirochaetes bacterium]|nr:cation diffusion facilitator family transporter [Spirochaetota bacterium]